MGTDPGEEDEFEKEMQKILDERLHKAEIDSGIRHSATTSPIGNANSQKSAKATSDAKQDAESNNQKYYDKMYFDSDDDSESEDVKDSSFAKTKSGQSGSTSSKQRQVLTNDELMYDPNLDDEDQAWADGIRHSYQEQKGKR